MKTKEELREYMRDYRKRNRDRLNAHAAKWRDTNREKLREYNRDYKRKQRAEQKAK